MVRRWLSFLVVVASVATPACDRASKLALSNAASSSPGQTAIASGSPSPSPPTSGSSAAPKAAPPVAPPPPPPASLLASVGKTCSSKAGVHVATSPRHLSAGQPLRILATADGVTATSIAVRSPGGVASAPITEARLGPPASAFARIDVAEQGTYRIVVAHESEVIACSDIEVGPPRDDKRRSSGQQSRSAWEATRNWTEADEDLYSAWLEKLFDAPLSEQPSYDALHQITSDPKKNFLFDHFGAGEDALPPAGLRLDPDCADLPYYLRAYFAWKEGLPFGFSSCTRGSEGHAPTCLRHFSSLDPMDDPPHDMVRKFEKFARGKLSDTVHSGTGRTGADDDDTDYYPIDVKLETLRPGVVYADPYGHVLVVAKLVPQTEDAGGLLLAVDGQPDGTVGRKRFWEGNFLFSLDDAAMGSPGFKRFRKVALSHGDIRLVSNEKLASDPAYADFGKNQYTGGAREFYDLMEDVLSPTPRDPEHALLETLQALEEQVRTRLTSVANGADRFEKKTSVIDMPNGTTIFETTGEWEDFSTPSRDMRLLIAIDVATGFPARYARRPARYRGSPGKSTAEIKTSLEALLQRELTSRKVTYERSDGSAQELSLADVVARQKALEMAYNPNDCIESRWGAPEGSAEAKTCHRHAPTDQRRKMEKNRVWFAERKRPARK